MAVCYSIGWSTARISPLEFHPLSAHRESGVGRSGLFAGKPRSHRDLCWPHILCTTQNLWERGLPAIVAPRST
jgi:hypothetical protein